MSNHSNIIEESIGPAELLTDLQNTIARLFVELIGVENDLAEHAALEVRNHMAEHWGGQGIYFPKDVAFLTSLRDEQIYSEFTGDNHSELVRKYKVSKPWLYRILKRVHKRKVATAQGNLFGEK